MNTQKQLTSWQKRKRRIKKKLKNSDRARLVVFRSSKHIYAQVLDAITGQVLCSASTVAKDLKGSVAKLNKVDSAKKVGEIVGKLAKEKGIEEVVFDRNGFLYHGRIKALADSAREAGLKF